MGTSVVLVRPPAVPNRPRLRRPVWSLATSAVIVFRSIRAVMATAPSVDGNDPDRAALPAKDLGRDPEQRPLQGIAVNDPGVVKRGEAPVTVALDGDQGLDRRPHRTVPPRH